MRKENICECGLSPFNHALPCKPQHTPTPEEILKAVGAQIILGEWRFPFYGKDTVAQMLPLDEWIERRRRIGHSHEALLKVSKIIFENLRTACVIKDQKECVHCMAGKAIAQAEGK